MWSVQACRCEIEEMTRTSMGHSNDTAAMTTDQCTHEDDTPDW